MPVEVRGFARALCQTSEFKGADQSLVERLLNQATEPLTLSLAEGTPVEPFVRSGELMRSLIFVAQGTLIPWQQPYSELEFPFLVGCHELLMDSPSWMATYSATPGTVVVEIPRETILAAFDALPEVRARALELVLRRLSRFYWTSIAISGSPTARVAAALVSRFALDGSDATSGPKRIDLRQTELMRLTALSRTAVADGMRSLESDGLIDTGSSRYFSGTVVIADLAQLKDAAFKDIRQGLRERYVP